MMRPGQTCKRWEKDAENYLECDLVGYYTLTQIVRYFNAQATRQGWHHRTRTAIQGKIARMGLSSVPELDNFSECQLGVILKTNQDAVRHWRRAGLKMTYDRPGRRYCIKREDFADFVEAHPHRFIWVNRDGLEYLLHDRPDLLKKIDSTPKHWMGKRRRIKRLDTGAKFESIDQAAKLTYMSSDSIRKSLTEGVPVCGGVQWVDAS